MSLGPGACLFGMAPFLAPNMTVAQLQALIAVVEDAGQSRNRGHAATVGSTMVAASKKMTFDWMQRWRDVNPGAGAFMSEAGILEPDFQQAFYGSNYDRLYQLKQRYDPFGVLSVPTAVDSEDLGCEGQVDGLPTQTAGCAGLKVDRFLSPHYRSLIFVNLTSSRLSSDSVDVVEIRSDGKCAEN